MEHIDQRRDVERYLSTNELMEMLGISRSTVYRLMDRGLPIIKIGAVKRLPKD
jgi:excisionase family DNA binding protein